MSFNFLYNLFCECQNTKKFCIRHFSMYMNTNFKKLLKKLIKIESSFPIFKPFLSLQNLKIIFHSNPIDNIYLIWHCEEIICRKIRQIWKMLSILPNFFRNSEKVTKLGKFCKNYFLFHPKKCIKINQPVVEYENFQEIPKNWLNSSIFTAIATIWTFVTTQN